MQTYQHWINGAYRPPASGLYIETEDPYRAAPWAMIPAGNADDAQAAVQAAHHAMTKGPWASMSPTQRGAIMRKIADLLSEHRDRLAEIEVRDNGKLLADMQGQLNYAASCWQYFAGLADKIEGAIVPIEKPDTLGMTFRQPIGVVLAITAWNSPLTFFALKCAPALAAGCAVVVKPSEFSTPSSIEFAALTKAAGLPDGVINVVSGLGKDVGAALVEHPLVAQVSFTGSDATGARIYESAARHMKRVAMELGGKSPNIIFADADLDAAVTGAISGIFGASGQMCTAGSRLLVEESVKDIVEQKLLAAVAQIKIGNPMDPSVHMGPISNKPQFNKVMEYVDIAKSDGARLIWGGKALRGGDYGNGHFVEPTIFSDVENTMRIAREEVFGPILSIITFKDEDEAIAIANDTDYGLAAGVWSRDFVKLLRVSKALEAGTVWANTYRTYSALMPFGGMKRSGVGRENGVEAVNEFLETKSIMLSLAQGPVGSAFVPK